MTDNVTAMAGEPGAKGKRGYGAGSVRTGAAAGAGRPAEDPAPPAESLDSVPATRAGAERGGAGPDIPIVFANLDDQRLYLAGAAVAAGQGEPVPLTPDPTTPGSATLPNGAAASGKRVSGSAGSLEPRALRYADFVLSPDRREAPCLRERHQGRKVPTAPPPLPLAPSPAPPATPPPTPPPR